MLATSFLAAKDLPARRGHPGRRASRPRRQRRLLFEPLEHRALLSAGRSSDNFPEQLDVVGDIGEPSLPGWQIHDDLNDNGQGAPEGTLGASLVDGTLTIAGMDPAGAANALTIMLSGTDLIISDASEQFASAPAGATLSNNWQTLTIPFALISDALIVELAGGEDLLTVDFSGGNPIPIGGLSYDGGAGGDGLALVGGAFHTSTYIYSSASDGRIHLDPDGTGVARTTIAYTGLEPITSSLDSQFVELVYSGGDETIAIDNAGGGRTRVTSTLGEMTIFADPAQRLELTATGGTDLVHINSLASGYASLVIRGDDIADVVSIHGALTFAAGHGLTVSDVGTVNLSGDASRITASGSGAVSITALRNIVLVPGSRITTADGDIILSANQQAMAAEGGFVGISLDRATISATGAGNIGLSGRGGTSGAVNYGVRLLPLATIIGGATGTVTVQGTGGNGGNGTFGVFVTGSGARITSGGGNVQVLGHGGDGLGANNHGVYAASAGEITSGGAGSVTVQGTGGSGMGGNLGVRVDTSSRITSGGGDVRVVGQGGGASGTGNNGILVLSAGEITSGGSGSVTVHGTGGTGTDHNYGVMVSNPGSRITSGGGSLHVTGQGGAGTGSWNYGVVVVSAGEITSSGSGAVMVQGTGGTGLDYNQGVLISGSNSRITSEAGDVLVSGRGGASSGSANYGVFVSLAGKVTAGSNGTVAVEGIGGPGTGNNFGVRVSDVGSRITSAGGNVQVTGLGGDASGTSNHGVIVLYAGVITSGGSGSVLVRGTGGTGSASNGGVMVLGSGSQITSAGGHVQVIGRGSDASASGNTGVIILSGGEITSGGGNVSVQGTGGNGTSVNYGVHLTSGSRITSGGGNVQVSGQGGGISGSSNVGVYVGAASEITSKGSGSVLVQGTGGNGSRDNHGTYLQGSGSRILSDGGNVEVIGAAGGGVPSFGIQISADGQVTGNLGIAAITLTADSMNLLSIPSVDAGAAVLRSRSAGTRIDLGADDVLTGSPLSLGLTAAELGGIIAATLTLGDATSGSITIREPIIRPASTDVQLITGDTILFHGGLDTAGGALLLSPGLAGSVQPKAAGADATTAGNITSFAPGSVLKINIAGTGADLQHDQLNVIGDVDLNSVVLELSGSYVSNTGDTFTLVSATAVSGTFAELAPGAVIERNTRLLQIEYGANTVRLTDLGAAELAIDVGHHRLAPNRAGQVIELYAVGGIPVTGFNLRARLGDGDGPMSEPVFSGADFTGGIWDAYPATVMGGPVEGAEQYLQASVVFTSSGVAVPAEGLVARLLIDTTGIMAGQFALDLTNTEIGADTAFLLFGGAQVPVQITNGSVAIAAEIVGRHIFYNNSYFDGNDAAANPGDDNAIATDKQALLPGGTADSANYTSYVHGINGIMVDVQGLADPAALTAASFEFRAGNSNDPAAWTAAPAPLSITVRAGAGPGGSDRMTLIWEDGAIAKQWLQVTVKATAETGLAEPDVFYFGNAVGESGNSTTNTYVDGSDFAGARDNPRDFNSRATVDSRFDYNRDSFVDGTDLVIARDNNTNFLTALKLISAPTAASQGEGEAGDGTAFIMAFNVVGMGNGASSGLRAGMRLEQEVSPIFAAQEPLPEFGQRLQEDRRSQADRDRRSCVRTEERLRPRWKQQPAMDHDIEPLEAILDEIAAGVYRHQSRS